MEAEIGGETGEAVPQHMGRDVGWQIARPNFLQAPLAAARRTRRTVYHLGGTSNTISQAANIPHVGCVGDYSERRITHLRRPAARARIGTPDYSDWGGLPDGSAAK